MPWLTIFILVVLIALCWGGGWGIYRSGPGGIYPGGFLFICGLVALIILVVVFVNNAGIARL